MKTLFCCAVAIVGLSSFAGGQSPAPRQTRVVYSPGTEITARDITYSESERTSYARGQVRIVSESSTITADEADVHLLNMDRWSQHMAVDLRGNVRVVVAPPAPPPR